MDVLLVNLQEHIRHKRNKALESLGLGYLAAVLMENGFDVEILDIGLLGLDLPRLVEEIKRRSFRVLGISVQQLTMPADEALFDLDALEARVQEAKEVICG